MKSYNTMDSDIYILCNYTCATMLFGFIRRPMYDYFGGSFLPDWKLLSVLMAAAVMGGVLLTLRRYRNGASILINVLLGGSVCLTVAVWNYDSKMALVAVAAAAATVLGYIMLLLVKYRGKGCAYHRVSLANCLSVGLINGRTLLALVLTVTMVGGLVFHADRVSAEDGWEEMTTGSEIETIRMLEDDVWPELSEAERLEVLQGIADIEVDYLGIDRVRVEIRRLEEMTLGHYNDYDKSIVINRDWLEKMDGFEVLEVLCHEAFHAYQYRLIDMYMEMDDEQRELYLFRDADRYQWEFSNYINGSEDYDAYAAQLCEIDSDAYAADAVRRYCDELLHIGE